MNLQQRIRVPPAIRRFGDSRRTDNYVQLRVTRLELLAREEVDVVDLRDLREQRHDHLRWVRGERVRVVAPNAKQSEAKAKQKRSKSEAERRWYP